MSKSTTRVWINANPSFKYFDGRVVRNLSRQGTLAYWEYCQNQDEASSIDIALNLLQDYLATISEPVDLIGHGTGGVLGLLYTRLYPRKVKSLTLISVGFNPATDWQAHYYQMRKLLPCSQERLLSRMVQMMFGVQDRANTLNLIKVLQQDLVTAPSLHSLYQQYSIPIGGVSVPLMVCGSKNDGIVDLPALSRWSECLRKEDRMLIVPFGNHFPHYFFPEYTAEQILQFWQHVELYSGNISLEAIK
ncbi:alpha/beta fold hydrolase [Pleurocapsa sp. PCC 7319]|uniref:alpha/beta fold hydrolase n=1 Tax=Pleurocapsa sp. PCC 7319 TaxID=118161 RepID=UPI00035EC923|nr:alpha/beta hydrolase [Pleurocapsa sp. PCC 7319]